MDVYLIPVGPLGADRHELYCEPSAHGDAPGSGAPSGSGRVAAMLHRVKAAIGQAEDEQRTARDQREPAEAPAGWNDRMKRRMLRWIAEKVAEQRLLWRLRGESDVTLHFPDDLPAERALAVSREMLQREAAHHGRWTIIDGALFCASAIVAMVPGPNLIAYYFGFRLAGHYLSRQGAKHGLEEARWQCQPSGPLSSLRQAISLAPPERDARVRDVASALHLPHLTAFFERTAIGAA